MFDKQKCPDPFADKVKCTTCKHWIDKSDAQCVISYGSFAYIRDEEFYCPEHKKPYDEFDGYSYYGKVRMSEDGTPVGYVKEPEKKKQK